MSNLKITSRASLSRRSLLQSAAALGVSSILPVGAMGQSSLPLHAQVAAWVKDIIGAKPGVLSVLCPDGSQKNLEPIARAFTEMTGVEIKLRIVPSESLNTQIALEVIAGESQFDVALPATFGVADLVASDVVLPLDTFVSEYEPMSFRDDALYRIGDSFDHKTYGFQADGDAYLMFYHKDMLENPKEAAGYEDKFGTSLDVPQSWAELDRQMEWFHRPEDNQWGGMLLRASGYLAWEWWVRFHAYGVWPFSEDMVSQIDSVEGQAALDDMIRSAEFLHPNAKNSTFSETWRTFAEGRSYCNIGWGGSQKYYNRSGSAVKKRLRYGPTPGGAIGPGGAVVPVPYFNWGWSYVINRASTQPRVGYLFSLFAASPEMSTRAVRESGGFFDPTRPEHYNDPVIQDVYSKPFLDVHKASLQQAIPDLYLMGQAEYFRVLNEALADAINGNVTSKNALKRASQLWEMITSRIGRAAQINRWQQLRAKYPRAVSQYLRDKNEA